VKYWEDFRPGDETVHGTHTVTEAEMIEFAGRYDPQPIHVDPGAASGGPFGGLIASGWHLACLFASLWVPDVLATDTNMWSPGIEELRWLVPVHPGDELTARSRVVETWPSRSGRGRGTVVGEYELINQRDEVVMRFLGRGQIPLRSAAQQSVSPNGGVAPH
jgi:acyl dehydratase